MCEHEEFRDVTIRLGGTIREIDQVCGNEECSLILAVAHPRAEMGTLVRRVTLGKTEWRITIERVKR